MKRYFKGLYMSLGMFCAIPLPMNIWDDVCINLMLPSFPLVGGLIGILWWGLAELLVLSGIHIVLVSAVTAVFPFFITGFLHLDGYMDTSDAILSRRPLEDKLRILKDPHTGAFAVIMLAVLFVLQFSAVYVIITENDKFLTMLIAITIMSRCCSSMSIMCMKPMSQSGYANMFRQNTKTVHKVFTAVVAVSAITLSYIFAGLSGIIVVSAVMTGYIAAIGYTYREFKGVSGDLAGYALVTSELCGLFVLALM